ncbi:MAG: outer membrane lipoprotein-sorting protein [Terrimicrobiaceae bacterium]
MTKSALLFAFALVSLCANAAEPLSAKDLAGQLSKLQQDGSSYIRLRLTVNEPPGTKKLALQLQIQQRRTANATDVIYQILWPKERMGESVLLKKIGNQAPTGFHVVPPDTSKSLGAQDMKNSLLGSDLAYADIIENFYAWDSQALVGEEMIGKVNCQILESKPGKGQSSIYTSSRSWVDTERLVPLRVEKFLTPGKPARRIETTRVTKEENGQHTPANLSVQDLRKNSLTELEGSRLNTRVEYQDGDFTLDALKDIKRSKPAASP